MRLHRLLVLVLACIPFLSLRSQMPYAPIIREGNGPFTQFIIRGVNLVDGTGSPMFGPVDIVIEGNRITRIAKVGTPGVPIDSTHRPQLKDGGYELKADGMYALPGFIDMHGHIGGTADDVTAEYVFKLWMAQGITTIREPGSGSGLDWVLHEKKLSKADSITAPRIFAYTFFGQGSDEPIKDAAGARKWVQQNAMNGADGIKFFGAAPDIMQAALEENKKLHLRSACHHAQLNVTRWNVLNSARAGLTSMEHWYGLPEALFEHQTIQDYPADYNYQNEQDRFSEAGKLWKQAAAPYSPRWNEVMEELLALDFTLDPTFNIYEANRDLMRARTLEWHQDYTMPKLWEFFQPSRESHGSYWLNWGTEQEVDWKENYRLWLTFVNEYKNRGGRVTTGSDSGYIFELFGFAYIRELELLREAGFHPLEVIRSATLYGAQALGADKEIGSVEVGKLADIILLDENPLQNLQCLYGTGAIKLNDDNIVERVGGVRYTVKDGIIYDAKQMLRDVKAMVDKEKEKTGFKFYQPGIAPQG